MKKLLAILLVAMLLPSASLCEQGDVAADEASIEAEVAPIAAEEMPPVAEEYIAVTHGKVVEIADSYVLVSTSNGQIRLNMESGKTQMTGTPEVGATVIATHGLAMANSMPPQVFAKSIRVLESQPVEAEEPAPETQEVP